MNKGYSIWQEQKENSLDTKISVNSVIIDNFKKEIDNFVQQNSPINNELIRNTAMNELYGTEVDGKLRIIPTEVTIREKHGNLEPVYSLCSFSYDDSVDFDILNKNGRFKITGYDRRVYNAVGTLWLNGRNTVSLTEIFAIMNGYSKSNPSSKQLVSIEKALHKLKSIRVFIDLTEEVKAHVIKDKQPLIDAGILKNNSDNIKSAVIEDNMIHFRIGTITSEQGKIFKSIQVVGEPSLLTYNRAKGTLISIPMEYIGLNDSNATEKTIAFQDYLLLRIIGFKSGKFRENKVLYDTLYRDSGIEKPESRTELKRDRETIKKLLDEWIKKDLIISYEEVMNGRSFEGFVFYVNQDNQDNKKIEGK